MFSIYKLKPIKFHPYTSVVTNRIFCMEYSSDQKMYYDIHECEYDLLEIFKEAGIKAQQDNKIVFECERDGIKIFYGFYDWSFSIGFGVHHYN